MSNIPCKHSRHQPQPQPLDFQGFLNDLQDWELSLNDKDKKLKPDPSNRNSKLVEVSKESERQPVARNSASQNHQSMNFDLLSNMPSSFMVKESAVDAVSEKDLGNEYFKQKKFNEAIDCYSRSIALSPTAVAYANRAMAYLKIKRFQEAENDCTEALNLDDRYVKAYSRRATARKELAKLRDSLEDIEFALRIEPQSEELKKQRDEVKSLLEKAILSKAAGNARRPTSNVKKVESNMDSVATHEKGDKSVADDSKPARIDVLPSKKRQESLSKPLDVREKENKSKSSEVKNMQQENGLHAEQATSRLKSKKTSKTELGISVQELASRAASRAMAEAAKNISPPTSAYQFEAYWRGFSGNQSLQARLLKVTPPETLPQIFKNAMTAPLLLDIVKCVATLFVEEIELAVKYLENMTKVPRFDMIIMCLPPTDKADLCKTWNEVFLSEATSIEYSELLNELHPRYCPRS